MAYIHDENSTGDLVHYLFPLLHKIVPRQLYDSHICNVIDKLAILLCEVEYSQKFKTEVV